MFAYFSTLCFISWYFPPKSANGKGQSQRLPIKAGESGINNAEPAMTGVRHKSSTTQGNTEDLTGGQQDPRQASERHQRADTPDKVHPDTRRSQK